MADWEDRLWSELDQMEPVERAIAVGEMITRISQGLLWELARYRREQYVKMIDSGEYTYASLADSVGARSSTISRLVEEGRRGLREAEIMKMAPL